MIGNDIVDWKQAKRESNWQRNGFLAKLFTHQEQQLIREANNPEQLVWTLWCMKESVYKANTRATGKRTFAPQKIACELAIGESSLIEGTAFYDQFYQIRASLTANYVAGIAFLKGHSPLFQEVITPLSETTPSCQSSHIYHQIRQAGASVLSVPISATYIDKNEIGVPTLLITNAPSKPITIPISISHHGQYGAFVIDYSNCHNVDF